LGSFNEGHAHIIEIKRSAAIVDKIDSNKGNPRALWRTLNATMGVSVQQQEEMHTADEFDKFFSSKIDAIRAATANAPSPSFKDNHRSVMTQLVDVSDECVERLIMAAPCKHSDMDPMPTWLVKKCAVILSPYLALLFNESFKSSIFPASIKIAAVKPLLKKFGLDATDLKNYRPVSSLTFVSKLLERAVFVQITEYLESNSLLPSCQSAYRVAHSTETALLRTYSDLTAAADAGHIPLMALLNLSSAFDCVDHDILVNRLSREFGMAAPVTGWITSYLSDRKRFVKCVSVQTFTELRNTSRFGTLPSAISHIYG